jgi:type VI secretion system ImpM family protein
MFSFLKNNRQESEAIHESHVGCLGKLPIYDEFIRHNVNGRSALELDDWIQQGYSHHTRSVQVLNDAVQLHSYTYNFVFTGGGEFSSTAVGTMMGSRDKSSRQYPFLLFKMLSHKYTESLSSALPCAYERFFDDAVKLCSADWSLQPINMLKKRVDALYPGSGQVCRQELMESEISSFSSVKCSEFWCETFGESEVDNTPLYIEVMRDLLATVVRKLPLRTTWGIEIPLPASEKAHIYVSIWVRMAETVLGSRGWRPHYIWGDIKNPVKQSLYLFFRPITPIFFSHLLGRRVDNGILINLEHETKNQSHSTDISKTIYEQTSSGNMISLSNEWAYWSNQ